MKPARERAGETRAIDKQTGFGSLLSRRADNEKLAYKGRGTPARLDQRLAVVESRLNCCRYVHLSRKFTDSRTDESIEGPTAIRPEQVLILDVPAPCVSGRFVGDHDRFVPLGRIFNWGIEMAHLGGRGFGRNKRLALDYLHDMTWVAHWRPEVWRFIQNHAAEIEATA